MNVSSLKGPPLFCWTLCLLLLGIPSFPAHAQRGVEIVIKLPEPPLIDRDAPSISVSNLLGSKDEEDLIRRGFPAQLRFSAELWQASSIMGRSISSATWTVIVDYEPLERIFRVVRFSKDGGQSLGTYREFKDVAALVARPYQPGLRAPSVGGRYFYSATLEVERMTENDLAEMRSWLGTAMQPERGTGSAIISFVGSLVKRLIGAQKKVYQGRSGVFEVVGREW